MSEEDYENMTDEEIVKCQIEELKQLSNDITGCAQNTAVGRPKFSCNGCPDLGNCMEYNANTIAILCGWIATYMEGSGGACEKNMFNSLKKAANEAFFGNEENKVEGDSGNDKSYFL